MRWPWSSRDNDYGSGMAAREQAENGLEEVQSRWAEVLDVAASLRELREQNHFADRIIQSMREHRS